MDRLETARHSLRSASQTPRTQSRHPYERPHLRDSTGKRRANAGPGNRECLTCIRALSKPEIARRPPAKGQADREKGWCEAKKIVPSTAQCKHGPFAGLPTQPRQLRARNLRLRLHRRIDYELERVAGASPGLARIPRLHLRRRIYYMATRLGALPGFASLRVHPPHAISSVALTTTEHSVRIPLPKGHRRVLILTNNSDSSTSTPRNVVTVISSSLFPDSLQPPTLVLKAWLLRMGRGQRCQFYEPDTSPTAASDSSIVAKSRC
ncbi:hypothetical protein DFP72DRAFT_1065489 [Ephemerocybe angulata]|uniref:Uncharacterized protein n=1 Tax=Ephemerocybe angulata TaxID=980116 RepID=A0A8H6I5E3_9AGAR|nr:hypothetical protein DFP72DRAFT_1065489 [Tulosesus angulatus]